MQIRPIPQHQLKRHLDDVYRSIQLLKQVLLTGWGVCFAIILFLLSFPDAVGIGDYNYRVCIIVFSVTVLISSLLISQKSFGGRNFYLAIVLSFALFVLVLIGFSASLSSWCCVRQYDVAAMCTVVEAVVDIMEKNQIPYWICWGSLLGSIREQAIPYQVVPWEHDFDICIYEKDFTRVMQLVNDDKKSIKKYGINLLIAPDEPSRVTDGSLRGKIARSYLDFFRYVEHESSSDILYTLDGGGRREIAKSAIEPFAKSKVCNRFMSSPAIPKDALKGIYGDSYMTPMWPPSIQGFACRLYCDCQIQKQPI